MASAWVVLGEGGGDNFGAGVGVDAEAAQVGVAGQSHEHGGGPAVFAEVGEAGVHLADDVAFRGDPGAFVGVVQVGDVQARDGVCGRLVREPHNLGGDPRCRSPEARAVSSECAAWFRRP